MALNDFYERLAGIAGQGQRQTDFQSMRLQRDKTKADMMQQIMMDRQRNVQFNAYAPDVMGDSGGAVGNNGGASFGGKYVYPLHGALNVTSPYGATRKGHAHPHTGIDWGAKAGTPIYAPGDAMVRSALMDKIYGNQTILDLGGGKSMMFGHQSKFAIRPGQHVKAGQLIGYVGSTGWSTGPHLHFESWINNKPVNPLSWFM